MKTMSVGTCTYTVQDVEAKGDKAFLVTGHDKDDFWSWVVWLQRTKKLVTIFDGGVEHAGYFVETVLKTAEKIEGAWKVQVFCRKYKAG